jgi:hypothetical protein
MDRHWIRKERFTHSLVVEIVPQPGRKGTELPLVSTGNGNKKIPFQIIAQILIFSGLIVLGLLVLWPVRRALHGGMIGVRDGIISRMETVIGRKIRYSSISPSILGAFDIRNVRIVGADDVPVLQAAHFRLSWSLMELLRGRARAIRSIRLESPVLSLDRERDGDIIRLLQSLNTGERDAPDGIAALLPARLSVRVRGGQCFVRNGGDRFDIQELNVNAELTEERIVFDGRWNAGVALARIIGEPLETRIAMRVNGDFSSSLQDGSAAITIPSVSGDVLRMRPLGIDLTLENKVLGLRKTAGPLPFDFFVDYGLEAGNIFARFSCENFMLRELISFSGEWEGAGRLLDIAGSGAASFERDQSGKVSYRIDLAGAIPKNEVKGRAAGASFEIAAGGDEKLAQVEAFRFFMPQTADGNGFFHGELGFRGSIALDPLAPNGVLTLGRIGLSGQETVSAQFTVSTQGREINLFSETASIGQVDLSALNASFTPLSGDWGFAVSALRFRNTESWSDVRLSSFSLEGSMSRESRQLEASLLLDAFSAADLSDMLRPFTKEPAAPAPLLGLWRNVSITSEIFFTAGSDRLLYNAPRFIVAYEGGKSMVGLVSVSGTNQRFELSEGRIIVGNDALLFSGRSEFASPLNISFSLNANYRELFYYLDGFLLNRRSLSVQGSHGFRMSVTAADGGSFSGSLEGREIPVPYRGHPASLSFFASLRYHSPASWSMTLDNMELLDIASPAGPARLKLAGGANQNGAVFPLMQYGDSLGPLSGRADISWTEDFSGCSGSLTMEAGQERYRMEGVFGDGELGCIVSGSRMRLDRLFEGMGNALADGNARISWDLNRSFRAELTLDSFSARLQERELRASAHAVLDGGEFLVRDMRFNLAGFEGTVPLFRVNRIEGIAETRTELGGFAGGRRLEGTVSLDTRFKPIDSWFEIGGALGFFNGVIHAENIRYADLGPPETFDINFSRGNGAISVSGGPKNMLRFQMDREGNFYAGLSSPFPVRGTAIGSVSNKTINARCGDLYIDLAELWKLLPRNLDIELAGGYVTASVDIRGPLADPEFFGAARGSSVRIRVPRFITQDIRPIPFTVAIEGNEMRFGPLPATVGSGAGTTTGWFRFDRWIPNIFNMEITVPRESPIPFGFDITGFLAHGDAFGKLNLAMEDMVFGVSGDLVAGNTEISLDSEEINRTREQELFSDVQFPVMVNLNVSTGPTVEFLWPSSDFPILRANPDMGTKVHVAADTTARQFSVTSDIKIRGGEIFYFERSFYIRSGTLVFRENERNFDPRLTARAEVRDRTADGPVTISMIVENAPLLSFTARFESTPSLSQVEIFALLGQNLTGSQIDADTGSIQSAFLSSTADLFAQFLLVRQLERQIRNFMRLDMFSVRTNILQNAILNAQGIAQNPVDRRGAGNYFDNTTVFMGKYFGQDLFVQSMLSMRYDANQASMGGLRFEPDIGIELQSPLFNIRWDFVPAHPENWWVNDNSITLNWSWTF